MTLSWASYGNTEAEVGQYFELIIKEGKAARSLWKAQGDKREAAIGEIKLTRYTGSGELLIDGEKEMVLKRVDEYKRFAQEKQRKEGRTVDIGLKTRRR